MEIVRAGWVTRFALQKDEGYAIKITDELLAQDLPPQFFYLALQESDFDRLYQRADDAQGDCQRHVAVYSGDGGEVRFENRTASGSAAARPGRRPAPLRRETKAAARYIKDLYSTDAQASGLLVMACYNWGED